MAWIRMPRVVVPLNINENMLNSASKAVSGKVKSNPGGDKPCQARQVQNHHHLPNSSRFANTISNSPISTHLRLGFFQLTGLQIAMLKHRGSGLAPTSICNDEKEYA
jgi:hypothetical protein